MGINVNMDGVEAASGWEPIPDGQYTVVVSDWDDTIPPSRNGDPGVKLTLKVINPPKHEGHQFFDRWYFGAKSLPFIRQRLEALRVAIPSGGFDIEPEMVIGKAAIVTMRAEPYEGRNGPAVGEKIKAYDQTVGSDLPVDPLVGAKKSADDETPF